MNVLVDLGGALVLVLVELVGGSTECTRGAAGQAGVANVALGLLLVGFLGGFGGVALDGLADIVDGVSKRVADLSDDALIWRYC